MKLSLACRHATLLRLLGAALVLAFYICAYFPFALWVRERALWKGEFALPLGFAVAALMSTALLSCGIWHKPRTLGGRVAFWAYAVSTAATWFGLSLLLLPQEGGMGIGIYFLLSPIRLNTLLISLALVSLLTALIQGEKLSIVAVGLVLILGASFFFSAIDQQVPPILDKVSHTNLFSKMVRRYRIEPNTQSFPSCDEMVRDIALIKKGPLDYRKLYHLETAAWKGAQYRGPIIDEMIDEFPTVKEFELRRRVLMTIDRLAVYGQAPALCKHDLVFFRSQIIEQREGDLSDIAATALTYYQLRQLLTNSVYRGVLHSLANYALDRQIHAPTPDAMVTNRRLKPQYSENTPWFMYNTFDCTGEITAAASNLVQQAHWTAADREAASNLMLFSPYLDARQAVTARSWLKRLQERVNN
jgi:hypothetical protein